MADRPYTTLFLVMSLDGKISSGDKDTLDVDSDWRRIHGVKEGLYQYYDLEKQTDACFFQSGRVFEKIGFNEREPTTTKIPVTGVIVDNKPHLNEQGMRYLSSWLERVIVVTTHPNHPGEGLANNIHLVEMEDPIDFSAVFRTLKLQYGTERMTIQSGGTLNAELLRAGLIDEVSIVVAPLLVGGSTTSTLVDGEAIHSVDELHKLRALEFISCNLLKHSYVHLRYKVLPETTVDPL